MGRLSHGPPAHREAEVEEADGSNSMAEGVGSALTVHGKVNNLEVEEELSTMATLARAEGVWVAKRAEGLEADPRSAHLDQTRARGVQ